MYQSHRKNKTEKKKKEIVRETLCAHARPERNEKHLTAEEKRKRLNSKLRADAHQTLKDGSVDVAGQ